MERLVVELERFNIEQINEFEYIQHCESLIDNKSQTSQLQFTIKSCFPNMSIQCDEQMPEKKPNHFLNAGDEDSNDETSSVSTEPEENSAKSDSGSNADSEAETVDMARLRGTRGGRYVDARKMPERACKRSNLRTLMKPQKASIRSCSKLRDSQIQKIYTNKKLTNFRPTSLETIFEEPQPFRGSDQYRLIGSKKLQRKLVCKDGAEVNKNVFNQRRARIKRNLGKRRTWKKIPLQNFLDYMEKSLNSENEEECNNVNSKAKETSSTTLNTINEIDEVEMKSAGEEEKTSKTQNIIESKGNGCSFNDNAVKTETCF